MMKTECFRCGEVMKDKGALFDHLHAPLDRMCTPRGPAELGLGLDPEDGISDRST